MIWRYILAWIPMTFIAILNGALRVGTYGKRISELRAHQVSTVTGIVLLGAFVGLLEHYWRLRSAGEALTIGAVWLVLTLAFEFLFGHYVAKNPWSRILHDYNILAGRVWVLIPIWIFIAPYVFYQLRW